MADDVKAGRDRAPAFFAHQYHPGMDAEELFATGLENYANLNRALGNEALAKCESPIERLFLAALSTYMRMHPDFQFILSATIPLDLDRACCRVWCVPQAQLGPYRVDFLLIDQRHTPARRSIIECDGHDFHERTKKQAQRDRSRDRWFTTSGMPVLRFTGSEIYSRPFELVDEVAEWLENR